MIIKDHKDVFISYGRKHSKEFATELYKRLTTLGYEIWFDQSDIPLGVDFQNQIYDGIERSDNFIFIISPHSVQSIYCRKEIIYAIKYNKRIIPILHIEPTDCWEEMHPTISKLNWIYFKEGINDFEESFKGLVSFIELHKSFVKQHTILLHQALQWRDNHRHSSLLLFGEERMNAELWLRTQFPDQQAPSVPTLLHCEYITESKKNANNLMTDLFFCYSREDVQMRDKLLNSFMRYGFTSWVDTLDIRTGVKFEEAIKEGIERADTLLYLISPASVKSEYCQKELTYALSLNKQIIPLVIEELSDEELPEVLKSVQYFDFSVFGDGRYNIAFNDLIRELNNDKEYYRQHKILLVKAVKWVEQNYNASILLRGYELQNAESWLKIARNRTYNLPTKVHSDFIEASQKEGHSLTTEVFVSYSRADSDFARKLNEDLQSHGKTTWFDQESIASGTDFQKEIYNGIESTANFLFVISNNSVRSPYCDDEVAYAQQFNKRFITILYQDVDTALINPTLSKIQWIDFNPDRKEYHQAFSEVLRTLDTDREHVLNHTKWLQRTKEWETNQKNKDLLLRGTEFEIAQQWMTNALTNKKNPLPASLQIEFIEKSKDAIQTAIRKKKRVALILRIMLVVMSVLLVFSVMSLVTAIEQRNLASIAEQHAISEQKKADKQSKIAAKERDIAQQERERAEQEQKKARNAEIIAKEQKNRAEIARLKAEEAEVVALIQKLKADTARVKADSARLKAERLLLENEKLYGEIKHNLLLAMSRNLSNRALQALNENNVALATQMAIYAHYLNRQHNGPQQNNDNYTALYQCLFRLKDPVSQPIFIKHNDGVKALSIANQASLVASSGDLGDIFVWKKSLPSEIITLNYDYSIRSLKFNSTGKFLAVGALDGNVLVWNLNKVTQKPISLQTNKENLKPVKHLSFISPNQSDELLLTGSVNGFTILRIDDDKLAEIVTQGINNVVALTNSSDGSLIVAYNSESLLFYRFDTNTNKTTQIQAIAFKKNISALALSPNNKWLAAGNDTGSIWLARIDNLTPNIPVSFDNASNKFTEHISRISALSFNSNSTQLASASLDKTVRIWNLNNLKEERFVLMHDNWVWSLDYEGDNRYIYTASENAKIFKWFTSCDDLAEQLKPYIKHALTDKEWTAITDLPPSDKPVISGLIE